MQVEEPEAVKEISVEEFAEKMKSGNGEVVLIDVREPHEYDICSIEGSKLIPLGEIKDRIDELNPDDEIVVQCHCLMKKALKTS